MLLGIALLGCESSNVTNDDLKIKTESPDPLQGVVNTFDEARYLLSVIKGSIPVGADLVIILPGIKYPDLTEVFPKVTAKIDGKLLKMVQSSSTGNCSSPSRTEFAVHFNLGKGADVGELIEVNVQGYRLPSRSVNNLPVIIYLKDPPDRASTKVATFSGKVTAGKTARVYIDGPSKIAPEKSIPLKISSVDSFGNPASFEGGPLILEINGERPDLTKIILDNERRAFVKIPPLPEGVYRFSCIDGVNEIGKSGPTIVTKSETDLKYFWGDPHNHTGFSDGFTTAGPSQSYGYAKNTTNLDFAVVTDHAEAIWGCPLSKEEIDKIETAAASYNSPGKFVTFFGFEWTGSFPWNKNWPVNQGHAHVIFPADGVICRADTNECNSFEKLIEKVEPFGPMVIRHHVCSSWAPATFPDKSLETMPVLEIASSHGSCECNDCPGLIPDRVAGKENYIRSALLSGIHYGIVGGSDNHNARPGARKFPGKENLNMDAGGLTCVIAKELTREGIFSAIKGRSCYATTSARIFLDFTLAGKPMGKVLPTGTPVKGTFRVHGADIIDQVTIFRGDILRKEFKTILSIKPAVLDVTGDWSDPSPVSKAVYYLRVIQKDGEMAWSSPIWVE